MIEPGANTCLLPRSPEATTHQDDEYVWAGVEDPKVVVTTSRDPSSRLKQFAKVKRNMWMLFISVMFMGYVEDYGELCNWKEAGLFFLYSGILVCSYLRS